MGRIVRPRLAVRLSTLPAAPLMPESLTIKVENLSRLAGALRKFGEEGAPQRLGVIHRVIAEAVADKASGKAPRLSGRLAGSIRATASPTRADIRAGGAGIPYAMPIHWGWPKRNIRKQPFLFDALRDMRPEIERAYEDGITQLADEFNGDD